MRRRVLLLLLVLSLSLGAAAPARAMDRDLKAVLIGGVYGLVAGTAVGLLSWPIAGDSRAIFIGTSLGLYLGIAAGVYHVTHRDDPGNPLKTGVWDVAPTSPYALTDRTYFRREVQLWSW